MAPTRTPAATNNPLIRLADYAATWQTRPLSRQVEHHARRALLDWFGALLPGCVREPGTLLAKTLAPERGPGRAICYVDGSRGTARHAALINATASHTVEFDDIYRDAGFHAACPTISTALAVAQARGASFEEFLRAVIAGYEIGCRIGLAVQPSHYRFWHVTGTVGTFSAAVATGTLLGLDAKRLAHAIAIAATFAGGLQQTFRGEGMSKSLHPGHAADAGILAAMAASGGVTGALDVLHGEAGFAAATSEDTGKWHKAIEEMEGKVAIEAMTFKYHGCCGHIFPALDALREMKVEHGFANSDIAEIRVGGYRATANICDRPNPTTEQEARFSTQYCAAALLVLGGVRLAAFEPENLASPQIRNLIPKVSVFLDPEIADVYPTQRAANVSVTLTSGAKLYRHQPTRKGDPDDPLSDAELSEKFLELSTPYLGADAAARLQESILTGHAVPGELVFVRSSA